MKAFRLILAILFLSYLLPTEGSLSIAQAQFLKATAHDFIQSLPSTESLAARALHTSEKNFQPFIFASSTPASVPQAGSWRAMSISEFNRFLVFNAYNSRAPPV